MAALGTSHGQWQAEALTLEQVDLYVSTAIFGSGIGFADAIHTCVQAGYPLEEPYHDFQNSHGQMFGAKAVPVRSHSLGGWTSEVQLAHVQPDSVPWSCRQRTLPPTTRFRMRITSMRRRHKSEHDRRTSRPCRAHNTLQLASRYIMCSD